MQPRRWFLCPPPPPPPPFPFPDGLANPIWRLYITRDPGTRAPPENACIAGYPFSGTGFKNIIVAQFDSALSPRSGDTSWQLHECHTSWQKNDVRVRAKTHQESCNRKTLISSFGVQGETNSRAAEKTRLFFVEVKRIVWHISIRLPFSCYSNRLRYLTALFTKKQARTRWIEELVLKKNWNVKFLSLEIHR